MEQLPESLTTPSMVPRGTRLICPQQRILSQVITVHRPGVIIAAAEHKGDKAPCLLPIQTLDRLPVGTVVVDLNTTRGGSAAGSQVDRQLQTGNGVWICHRSNYPNAEPPRPAPPTRPVWSAS